jgi:hypothetical protein
VDVAFGKAVGGTHKVCTESPIALPLLEVMRATTLTLPLSSIRRSSVPPTHPAA